MNAVCKELFKAMHEGKWLSIEYRNKNEATTKYWIGVKSLDPASGLMRADGLHLSLLTTMELSVYIDSIISAAVVEGTYYPTDPGLLRDIAEDPERYARFFHNTANLKVLNYLAECHRLDATPYRTDYTLLQHFDEDCLVEDGFQLTGEQFAEIVKHFQYKTTRHQAKLRVKQLCVNVLSIPAQRGLYVLAFRRLDLDVIDRSLRGAESITVCKEFTINGEKQSIRQFLDAEDYQLLEDVEANLEQIKDRITRSNPQLAGVDDRPYLMAVGLDCLLDLHHEYGGVMQMYQEDRVTYPIRAFFGDLVKLPVRRKNYPLALLNRKINLDQLLAIHNAMKYPLTYVQGPPGTGKTNTIVNAISTAFFNEKTVLFVSYNNHPIDGVFAKLSGLTYRGKSIPFPAVRLGNNEKTLDALDNMRGLFEQAQELKVYEATLERKKDAKTEQTQRLTALLERHEQGLDLRYRKEALEQMHHDCQHNRFDVSFSLLGQLNAVKAEIEKCGEVTTEEALELLTDDEDAFSQYLFFTAAKHIKRLGEPKNKDLLDIIYMENEDQKVTAFNRYLAEEENLLKFLRIFPIVCTTCISAHKLARPFPYFDMVIMDEASQCNTAVALVPILRGNSLMLVGDPQQLSLRGAEPLRPRGRLAALCCVVAA